MKYAKEYRTKKEAINVTKGIIARKNIGFVFLQTGKRIPINEAKIIAFRTVNNGYLPIAIRKKSMRR